MTGPRGGEGRKTARASRAATIDYHPFEQGAPTVDAAGHQRVTCAVCGSFGNAWRHRDPSSIKEAVAKRQANAAKRRNRPRLIPHPSTPPDIQPEPVRPPRIAAKPVADWRLSMLRLALDQALAGPELSYGLRLALLSAQRALASELYGQVATERAQVDIPAADPAPVQLPLGVPGRPRPMARAVESTRIARMRSAFSNDRLRELFDRALQAGWRWERTGSGHVKLYGPDTEGPRTGSILTIAVTGSARGHAFANIKAQAKRAGLDVEGL